MSNVKELAAELAGVLYDVDSGTGFDATCRHTIERVKRVLESTESFTEGVTADVFGDASLSLKLPVETIGFAVQDKEQLEVLLTNICFHAESVCDEDVIDALINSLTGFVNGAVTHNTTPVGMRHIKRLKEIRKDWKELNDVYNF